MIHFIFDVQSTTEVDDFSEFRKFNSVAGDNRILFYYNNIFQLPILHT